MGLIICEKHGESGIVETCEHVSADLKRDVFGQFHRVEILGNMLICDLCWSKYDLLRLENRSKGIGSNVFELIADENSFVDECIEIHEKLQSVVWCTQCIAEIQVREARSNGKLVPFPIYERTLNSHNEDAIQELRTSLATNFQFKKSNVMDSLAVFVTPGAYRYPLTVKIYYVTSENEQRQIVQLVDKFLCSKELNQAKVEFYEAKVWEMSFNQETGILSGNRGEEKLLMEVFLNC
jgi:hypothetical protein